MIVSIATPRHFIAERIRIIYVSNQNVNFALRTILALLPFVCWFFFHLNCKIYTLYTCLIPANVDKLQFGCVVVVMRVGFCMKIETSLVCSFICIGLCARTQNEMLDMMLCVCVNVTADTSKMLSCHHFSVCVWVWLPPSEWNRLKFEKEEEILWNAIHAVFML